MDNMKMEVESKKKKKSKIKEMVRYSIEKVGIKLNEERRSIRRKIIKEMNVDKIKVIVNDINKKIEILNEGLVKLMMERDDLHMEQDYMLVDIEDLTR
jgi:predicted ATP-dependent Lon-type protease